MGDKPITGWAAKSCRYKEEKESGPIDAPLAIHKGIRQLIVYFVTAHFLVNVALFFDRLAGVPRVIADILCACFND